MHINIFSISEGIGLIVKQFQLQKHFQSTLIGFDVQGPKAIHWIFGLICKTNGFSSVKLHALSLIWPALPCVIWGDPQVHMRRAQPQSWWRDWPIGPQDFYKPIYNDVCHLPECLKFKSTTVKVIHPKPSSGDGPLFMRNMNLAMGSFHCFIRSSDQNVIRGAVGLKQQATEMLWWAEKENTRRRVLAKFFFPLKRAGGARQNWVGTSRCPVQATSQAEVTFKWPCG